MLLNCSSSKTLYTFKPNNINVRVCLAFGIAPNLLSSMGLFPERVGTLWQFSYIFQNIYLYKP